MTNGAEQFTEAFLREKVREVIRRMEIFRPGSVSHVEPPADPGGYFLATVNGRPMPYIDPTIAVGDIVKYVDQEDPFCWAARDGFGVDGGGDDDFESNPFLVSYFGIFPFFPGLSSALNWSSTPTTPPGQIDLLMGVISTPNGHTTDVTDKTAIYEERTVGSGSASLYYKLAPRDVLGTYEYDTNFDVPEHNFLRASFRFSGVISDVPEVSDTVTSQPEFPTVTAPGADWVVIYVAVVESLDGAGGAGPVPKEIAGSSRTWDAAVTALDGALSPRPNLSSVGDLIFGYEVTTEAGQTTPRTLDVDGFTGDYAMTTLLVDTRPAA